MNSYNLKPVFDRRKRATIYKDQPIEIRVYFSRNDFFHITTGIRLYLGEWDKETLSVVRRSDASDLNKKLQKELNTYDGYIRFLIKTKKELNKENFQSLIPNTKNQKNNSFLDFMYSEIQKRNMKYSTRRMHLQTFEAVKRSGVIETFEDLTPQNIARYDRFLRLEDSTRMQTTIHNYHKRLKPYINEALRLGLIEDTPYRIFKDKHGKYRDRQPLNEEEIRQIKELPIEKELTARVRDLFLFCTYTGLSWADLYNFDYTRDVVNSNGNYFIQMKREKTGTPFFTPILQPAMDILIKYNYKFRVPVVQIMNRHLKKIKDAIGINKPITVHVARHSFATNQLLEGTDIYTLSKMMGHTNVKTTQQYAKVVDEKKNQAADAIKLNLNFDKE